MRTSGEQDWEIAEPRADALIESLRSFGYSPETAIADLVDNSIAAGATKIVVEFSWQGAQSTVRVWDDGRGMTESELVEAMRPGTMSPLEARAKGDLGRFGLGLKTASFSQARELTVSSRTPTGGVINLRRWDLDTVARTCQWRLLKSPPSGRNESVYQFGSHGTEVLWTKCDRLVQGAAESDKKAQSRFLRIIDKIKSHLSAVFHRFLAGTVPGNKKIQISINGVVIEPWDPFLISHPATASMGRERLPLAGESIVITPYVLPHRSKISQQKAAQAAGITGWNQQQGFYVYRENRLLVSGDWLGLGFSKDEHTKLARISVDFPAKLDSFWQIDVKKSTARPPGALADALKRIATLTRRTAEDVYRHRGKVINRNNSKPYVMAWKQIKKRDGTIKYQVNRDNPIVAQALAESGARKPLIESLLRFVEETVPTTIIGLSLAESIDHQQAPFSGYQAELRKMLRDLFDKMIESADDRNDVINILGATEPFAGFPELIADLVEETN